VGIILDRFMEGGQLMSLTREDMMKRLDSLTDDERKIVFRVLDNKNYAQIDSETGFSENTIKNKMKEIYAKLGIKGTGSTKRNKLFSEYGPLIKDYLLAEKIHPDIDIPNNDLVDEEPEEKQEFEDEGEIPDTHDPYAGLDFEPQTETRERRSFRPILSGIIIGMVIMALLMWQFWPSSDPEVVYITEEPQIIERTVESERTVIVTATPQFVQPTEASGVGESVVTATSPPPTDTPVVISINPAGYKFSDDLLKNCEIHNSIICPNCEIEFKIPDNKLFFSYTKQLIDLMVSEPSWEDVIVKIV